MTARPPEIDVTTSWSARVWDYLLGGTANFTIDRDVANRMAEAFGEGRTEAGLIARRQRAFGERAVRYLANEGVRQFLDIGCGIPQDHSSYTVLQHAAPESRIVYVDYDPVVLAHGHTFLQWHPNGAACLWEDLRRPEKILNAATETLDDTQPIAVLLVGVLPFVCDEEDPTGVVARLLDAVPPGSYLAIAHLASDLSDELVEAARRHNQAKVRDALTPRSHTEITRFFDGLQMVQPGLVPIEKWPENTEGERVIPVYGGLAQKTERSP